MRYRDVRGAGVGRRVLANGKRVTKLLHGVEGAEGPARSITVEGKAISALRFFGHSSRFRKLLNARTATHSSPSKFRSYRSVPSPIHIDPKLRHSPLK